MPAQIKKNGVNAKQAQKTGLTIMLLAAVLIFGLLLLLIWYFFFYSTAKNINNDLSGGQQTEIASTTADEIAVPEVQTPPIQIITETIDDNVLASTTATTTDSLATSSKAEIDRQEPLVIASSTDADADGLSDAEEAVIGTDQAKTDTDNDGFSDFAEFEKGYNPSGAGKISQTKVMTNFENALFGLIYPAQWQFTSSGNEAVIFQTQDEQMIQVSLQANSKNSTLTDWYSEQFAGEPISNDQYVTQVDANGVMLWQGIYSPNKLTFYLMNDKKQSIVSIHYNLGMSSRLNYQQIYRAMINSFVLKD